MSLAFLILAHKGPTLVERLFRAIYHPDDLVFLHCDRRSSKEMHALVARLAREHSNVYLLKSRAILWSGFEMSAVQLEAMQIANSRTDVAWHHFINLSGQDFPLKTRDYIESSLAADLDANFVSWFDPLLIPLWKNAQERVGRYYIEWPWLQKVLFLPGIGRRLRALFGWGPRPFLPMFRRKRPNFHYFGGANHVILSRAATRYLTSAPEAKRIVHWLEHTLHANEIVFQSVLLNSPLASTIVNEHLRKIEFENPETPHPRIWKADDFDHLVASPSFFARKFDETVDGAILDRLELYLKDAAEASREVHSHPEQMEAPAASASKCVHSNAEDVVASIPDPDGDFNRLLAG